jgi:hypothetical protein
MARRVPWFEVALSVVFLSATLWAAFSDAYNLPNTWFIRDDAYYYFKVAQNISEGHGSTFDGIHLTNGYHPLWLLICIPIFALARYDLILPLRVLAVVIGLLQLGTSILLYRLVRRTISEMAAILSACFWAFNTYILVFLYKTGVESAVTIFLVMVLLQRLYDLETTWRTQPPGLRKIALLGVLSVLIAFGRLDLAFFSLIVGLWIVFRGTPARYLLPLDVLALVCATVTAFLTRLGFTAYYDVSESVIIMLFAALACKLPIFYFTGLYAKPKAGSVWGYVVRLVLSVCAGSVVLALILFGSYALGFFPVISRAVLVLDLAISLGLLLVTRVGARLYGIGPARGDTQAPTDELRTHWRTWLREGAAFYSVVGGAMAAYMLWNHIVFGTSSPVSGQIKHWWATFTHSIYGTAVTSWLTFFAVNPFSEFNAWAPLTTRLSDWSNQLLYAEGTGFGNPRWQSNFLVVLLVSGLILVAIPLLRKRPAVRAVVQTSMIPLFVGSWLQILAYNITGYASAKEWYWLLEPILVVLLAAVLFRVLSDQVLLRLPVARYALWAAVAWYGLSAGFGYWRDAYLLNPYGAHARETPYTPIIPFLEANTEPGSLIGMTGGGNVGYLMPSRTVVNMDGLINSYDYFLAMKSGTSADYLYDTGLRYIFANPTILDSNPYRGQYSGRFEVIREWSGKDLLRLLPQAPN